jgi:hypothetical protein
MAAPHGNKNAKGRHKTYNEVHRKHGKKSTHSQTGDKSDLFTEAYVSKLKKKGRETA